jgi:hypothetical protein
MKHIKLFNSFKINEDSSMSSKELEKELENNINSYLSKFDINEPKDSPYWNHNDSNRKLITSVTFNESKYGLVCDVTFVSDFPLELKNINEDLLFIHNDIFDLVSKYFYPKKPIMSKFDFFGHKINGNKDGRTLEIQDITDKANDLVDSLKYQDLKSSYKSIFIQFIVK